MKKIVVALAVMGAFSSMAMAEDIQVAVAANYTAPIKEMAQIFEKQTGDKLLLSFGGTGSFYAQIKNGAPFQVFLAADAKTPQKVVEEGLGVAGTNFTYAMGRLAVWSATPDLIKDVKSVLDPKIEKVAVANPKLAPYGEAAYQTMDKLGITAQLQPKIVEGDNIGKTFQFVKSENAQAGFVALSQIYKDGKITEGSGVVVPSDLYAPIRQDAVLLNPGKDSEGAKRFLEFLKTNAEAAKIRESYGYGAP